MKRIGLALTLSLAIGSVSHVTFAQAQAPFAIATPDGNSDFSVIPPFIGPFQVGADYFAIRYRVLCVDRSTGAKAPTTADAVIPDGSTLAQLRTLSTTAVVNACLDFSISVARAAVILPAVQTGQ